MGSPPSELVEYLLIKNLYHCTPEELDRQDEKKLLMHLEFWNIEQKIEKIKEKRETQKLKLTQ